MGSWAKKAYGESKFADVGFIFAGTSRPENEERILRTFDQITHRRDVGCYHSYLASVADNLYPVTFNVYGAPAVMDILAEMHDGGCRTAVFVGFAYSFKMLPIGSIVLPTRAFHYEGLHADTVYHDRFSTPDAILFDRLKSVFNDSHLQYTEGVNISVPAVTYQIPHANTEYRNIQPTTVEMELAACLLRAKEIGIRAAGALVISDNRTHSIGDRGMEKHEAMFRVASTLIKSIPTLHLPPVPDADTFSINSHLASIIEDPDDEKNIYREGD